MFCGVTPWPICGFFWNLHSILRLRLSSFHLIMGRIQNDFWIQDLLFWIASAHSSNPTNIGCIVLNVSQYVATMIKDKCFQFDDDWHRFPDSLSRLSLAAVTLALFGASSWNFLCVFRTVSWEKWFYFGDDMVTYFLGSRLIDPDWSI